MTGPVIDVAVDIGGTFTDIVALTDGHTLHVAKVPTTAGNLVAGVCEAAERILERCGGKPAQVRRFVHSTTVATNAILERKGAITGVLMTDGFQDALEIGRQRRQDMYNVDLVAQTPVFLAPRRLRAGIRERIGNKGQIIEPLDEAQLLEQARHLRESHGVQALAVCYLFSFVNPVHEQRTRELLAQHQPEIMVSLSSDVDPVFREYERVVCTAFDAYVRPRVSVYLGELKAGLADMGLEPRLQVMQSRGGLTALDSARERPVTMLLSGPSAGVLGGRFSGELSRLRNLITLDMGGTSCDVALIREGKPILSRDGRIDTFPLRISMVDVNTVGAGGGSIAWVDTAGGLHVGPESAGATPGPACYGRGGTEPTVTDASVVLGYLNPKYFAGGDMTIDPAAAQDAVAKMAKRLELAPPALAAGIHRIVNDRMADEVRLVSVRKGYDPRQFALVCLGGAGPVHGGRIAPRLSIPSMLVPATPGVLAAFGLLVSPAEQEQVRAFGARSDEARMGDMAGLFAELNAAGLARMEQDGVPAADIRTTRSADVRYVGQSYELEVELASDNDVAGAMAAFHATHQRIYGHSDPAQQVEFVNLRVVHRAAHAMPQLRGEAGRDNLAQALKETRPAYFDDLGRYTDTPIYDRPALPPEEPIIGPAIIEQRDTTTVVYPAQTARRDTAGNLLVTTTEGG